MLIHFAYLSSGFFLGYMASVDQTIQFMGGPLVDYDALLVGGLRKITLGCILVTWS